MSSVLCDIDNLIIFPNFTAHNENKQQCVFDSPAQFSQSKLKFMNTLADKSKEEKFRIDVDVSLFLVIS